MTSLPPVTIVSPNVAGNAAGRALLLAELLATETSVRIAGPQRGDGIWSPATSSKIPILAYPWPGSSRYSQKAVRWLREVSGNDVLIASKPLAHSLGLALAARKGPRRMVVDIDDWESGFAQLGANNESRFEASLNRLWSYLRRGALNAFVLTRALEEYAKTMPHRLVSNHWLERRFGGRLLYHVRDPEVLDPSGDTTHVPALPRDRVWVGFVGTPRRHKGVHVLIEALARLAGSSAPGLALIGVDEKDSDTEFARSSLPPERFRALPRFPFERLREHVAAVDIIAIPSLDVPASRGQVPAKVFDAMAMAKPVVATRVNDLPEICEGCGIVVAPGSVSELSRALERLAEEPALRQRLGAEGRRKLIARYSYAVGRRVIVDVVRAAAG